MINVFPRKFEKPDTAKLPEIAVVIFGGNEMGVYTVLYDGIVVYVVVSEFIIIVSL